MDKKLNDCCKNSIKIASTNLMNGEASIFACNVCENIITITKENNEIKITKIEAM